MRCKYEVAYTGGKQRFLSLDAAMSFAKRRDSEVTKVCAVAKCRNGSCADNFELRGVKSKRRKGKRKRK